MMKPAPRLGIPTAFATVLIVGILATPALSAPPKEQPTPDPNRYEHDYQFGADWFWPSIPNWERHLAHLKN